MIKRLTKEQRREKNEERIKLRKPFKQFKKSNPVVYIVTDVGQLINILTILPALAYDIAARIYNELPNPPKYVHGFRVISIDTETMDTYLNILKEQNIFIHSVIGVQIYNERYTLIKSELMTAKLKRENEEFKKEKQNE